jgi:hypothetical protein
MVVLSVCHCRYGTIFVDGLRGEKFFKLLTFYEFFFMLSTVPLPRGDAHFWLTYHSHPPPPDLDPDPHQDFELHPDPDPHQNSADPQPWAQLSKDCCLIYKYVLVNKLAFFLNAHCLIFSHNQPFRLGGGVHMAGGDAQGGGGGMHVHPVHPPWVRPCRYRTFLTYT